MLIFCNLLTGLLNCCILRKKKKSCLLGERKNGKNFGNRQQFFARRIVLRA